MTEILLLSLLGGLLALDETSVGQFMLSRPVVAGTITGWMVGTPVAGFAIGALLEVYLLVEFPVGGAAFPEGAPAAVIAVAAASMSPLPGAEALGIAVGLVWGQLGGMSVARLRSLNARLAPDTDASRVLPSEVARAHIGGLGLDLARGLVVNFTGLVVGRWCVLTFAEEWPFDPAATRGLLLLGGLVSLGILLENFGGYRKRAWLFGLGALAGLGLGWVL